MVNMKKRMVEIEKYQPTSKNVAIKQAAIEYLKTSFQAGEIDRREDVSFKAFVTK